MSAGLSRTVASHDPDARVGRYQLLERVASGGMGEVWRVRDDDGRTYALKRLRSDLASPELRRRFERELRIIERVRSEFVVAVADTGSDEPSGPYLVMELLEGQTLAEFVKQSAPLDPRLAVDLLLQAIAGVAAAHAIGVVHRDLKLSNFFVASADGGPRLKLLDFGIAKPLTHDTDGQTPTLTHTGAALGSMGYLAPEQARSSRRVDERADIWALGSIAFRMLSGAPPFPATSTAEYIAMIASEVATPLRSARPDASAELEAIVARCLEADPARRFQTLGALARALAPHASTSSRAVIEEIERLVPGAESDATLDAATVAADEAGPEPRRMPWLVGLAAVLCAAAAVLGWQRTEGDASQALQRGLRLPAASVAVKSASRARPPASVEQRAQVEVAPKRPSARPVTASKPPAPQTAVTASSSAASPTAPSSTPRREDLGPWESEL